jgi:hypothetical protein
MGAAFLFTAVGVDMPAALVVMVFPVLPALLLVPGPHRVPLWGHGVVLFAGVALFALGRWAPPDAAHPTPGLVRHIQDLDNGKAYRVAGFATLDDWSRAALGDTAQHKPLPWSNGRKLWWTEVRPARVPSSLIDIRREGTRVVITVKPSAGAYESALQIRPAQMLDKVQLDGRALHNAIPVNSHSDIHVYAPDPRGFTLSFTPHGPGKIDLTLFTTYFAWPEGAAPLPPMPKGVMAFGTSGSTQTIAQRQLRW